MPSMGTSAIKERFARKLSRAFYKLTKDSQCRFISGSGLEPYFRGVHLLQAQRDGGAEYITEPIFVAEFLLVDGQVLIDDLFEINGQQYKLTQRYESDQVTDSFVYVAY